MLYFADRANFPYGSKSRVELLAVMRTTIERLERYSPAAVVIASNAPAVMVLDELRTWSRTPLVGVFPPVRRALNTSVMKRIAVLVGRRLVDCEPRNQGLRRTRGSTSRSG